VVEVLNKDTILIKGICLPSMEQFGYILHQRQDNFHSATDDLRL